MSSIGPSDEPSPLAGRLVVLDREVPDWHIAIALMLLTLSAYLLVILNAGFIWDDDRYVTANRALTTTTGLFDIWLRPGATIQYYPLTFTSFWIERRLWGGNPAGYHLVNMLLHGANALLLWRLLRGLGLGAAALVAATIFAVHPVHVESVAWIAERKNVLSTFFYLLAAWSYWRFLEQRPRQWQLYAAAVTFFLAAMLSKTVACTFPAAILVVLWWKKRLTWREALLTAPMFAVGLALSRVTASMEKWSVGATGPEWDFSIKQRLIIAGRAIWFYAGKLLWPHPLMFSYPRWKLEANDAWAYAPLAGVVVFVAALGLLHKRIGRGPFVALLFFVGTLVPALGLVNVYPMRFSFVADHFQYLASIAPIVLVAQVLVRIGGAPSPPRMTSQGFTPGVTTISLAAIVITVIALAGLTFARTRVFECSAPLWRDTLAHNDSSWLANYNLGLIESRADHWDAAMTLFEKAAALEPNESEIQNSLGRGFMRLGNPAEGEARFRRAIDLRADNFLAHRNLAQALALSGHLDEALVYASRAAELKPDWLDGRLTKGHVLAMLGRTEEATAEFQAAMTIDPNNAEARSALRAASPNP